MDVLLVDLYKLVLAHLGMHDRDAHDHDVHDDHGDHLWSIVEQPITIIQLKTSEKKK